MARAVTFWFAAAGDTIPYAVPADCTLVGGVFGNAVTIVGSPDPAAMASDVYSAAGAATFDQYIFVSFGGQSQLQLQLNYPLSAGETIFLNADGAGNCVLFFDAAPVGNLS